MDVLLSVPRKLSRLCRAINPFSAEAKGCVTKHRNCFVTCAVGAVYSIPLSRRQRYVSQTRHCFNKRLREHACNVTSVVSDHLGIDSRDCGCHPDFQQCKIVKRPHDTGTREIVEALEASRSGAAYVSGTSIALNNRDVYHLTPHRCKTRACDTVVLRC